MLAYQPAFAFRPQQVRLAQAVVVPAAPVVSTPAASSPLAGAPVPEGLFWTAVAAAASWAAITTGMRKSESTFMRGAGWVGGIGAGLAALVGLTGVLAPSAARTLPIRWYWI